MKRLPADTVRTAWANARRDPTSTTSRFALVTAVYRRFRCNIIQAPVVTGITTAGYSLPWDRWMVIA